jgi:hypothetical protein
MPNFLFAYVSCTKEFRCALVKFTTSVTHSYLSHLFSQFYGFHYSISCKHIKDIYIVLYMHEHTPSPFVLPPSVGLSTQTVSLLHSYHRLVCLVLSVLAFDLRASWFLSNVSTSRAVSPSPLCLVLFQIESHCCPLLASDHDTPTSASKCLGL